MAEENETLTFDDMLKNKEYQSEFDKRVAKALETSQAKWQTKYEADIEAAKTTAKNEVTTAYEEEKKTLNSKLIKAMAAGEIIKSKARDASDILAMIDMSKVTYKDGEINGLAEQIEELKGKKSYLFETEKTEDPKEKKKGGLDHEGKDEEAALTAKMRSIMGLSTKKE